MAIDSNGIYHYTAGDVVNSWPAFMNLGMSSISTKFAGVERNYTYTAGSQAAADALRIDKGSSAASPLFVFRTDTKKLMLHNGSSWSEVIPPVILDPNEIRINGTAYQRSGTLTSIPQTPAFTQFGATYAEPLPLPCRSLHLADGASGGSRGTLAVTRRSSAVKKRVSSA